MKFLKNVFLNGILIGLLGIIFLYFQHSETSTHVAGLNYKVTLEIDTPIGIQKASAIRHFSVSCSYDDNILTQDRFYTIKGESVVLDLEGKKIVPFLFPDEERKKLEKYLSISIEGKRCNILEANNSPVASEKTVISNPDLRQMIVYQDVHNPESAEFLDTSHNVEKLLGKGTVIKSLTYELTQEPVTEEIERTLPWMQGKIQKNDEIYYRLDGKHNMGDVEITNQRLHDISITVLKTNGQLLPYY